MANTAITIKDYYTSLGKEIPAKIDKSLLVFNDIISTTKHDKQSFWRIIVALSVPINKSHFSMTNDQFVNSKIVVKRYVESGLIDGKIKDSSETIYTTGKNIGKLNETNAFTQAIRDSLGIYTKQTRKTSNSEISQHPLPMLVKMEGKVKSVSFRSFYDKSEGSVSIQPKLNGARCMTHLHTTNTPNKYDICMYSRSGIPHKSMNRLKETIGKIFLELSKNKINVIGLYFDGEIYSHGKTLEYITGQMRNQSPDSGSDLEYYLYDIYMLYDPEMIFSERYKLLKSFEPIINNITDKIHILQTYSIENCRYFDEAKLMSLDYYQKFLDLGFEGEIIRNNNAPYELGTGGYHSSNIIKMKPIYDDEYTIVGFIEGKGKSAGTFTWIVETSTPDKTQFNVEHKNLTIDQRKKIFIKFNEIESNGKTFFENNIKGKPLKVEYFSKSNKGLPTLAKAVGVREEDTPDKPAVWSMLVSNI